MSTCLTCLSKPSADRLLDLTSSEASTGKLSLQSRVFSGLVGVSTLAVIGTVATFALGVYLHHYEGIQNVFNEIVFKKIVPFWKLTVKPFMNAHKTALIITAVITTPIVFALMLSKQKIREKFVLQNPFKGKLIGKGHYKLCKIKDGDETGKFYLDTSVKAKFSEKGELHHPFYLKLPEGFRKNVISNSYRSQVVSLLLLLSSPIYIGYHVATTILFVVPKTSLNAAHLLNQSIQGKVKDRRYTPYDVLDPSITMISNLYRTVIYAPVHIIGCLSGLASPFRGRRLIGFAAEGWNHGHLVDDSPGSFPHCTRVHYWLPVAKVGSLQEAGETPSKKQMYTVPDDLWVATDKLETKKAIYV